MPTGKKMIVDAGLQNGRNLTSPRGILFTADGQTVHNGEDKDGYTPHWPNCRDAKFYRR